MKRGGPLPRLVPLVPRKRMRRTKWVPSLAPRERVERTSKPASKPRRRTGFPQWVRDAVNARSAGLCEICGVRPWTEIHHRRPRGGGGTRRESTSLPSNALALCSQDHHELVESRREWALVRGWLVNQQEEPSRVPVLLHHGWVRLDDEGGYEPSEGGL